MQLGKPECGGGAIFNIVGHTNIQVGWVIQANNVEGGSSREARRESRRPWWQALKDLPTVLIDRL